MSRVRLHPRLTLWSSALALLALLASAMPVPAAAQWMWLDGSGRRVFSDTPPPADIPAKNILRQPAGVLPPAAPSAVAAPAATSAPAPVSAPRPVAGRDGALEEKKKQQEAAEAEKRKAEERQFAQQRAENCRRAREAKSTMDSGLRVARVNEKGEREFLDDKARGAESERLQNIIGQDCGQ